MKNYKKLQNGSDIRGIAITGVPGQLPNLTADEASDIARGFLIWLRNKNNKKPADLKIAIGRDPRVSGQHLLDGLMNCFGSYGVKVYDCGLASTPAMFMTTQFADFKCDGGLMITASHLPYNRNGFKFFTPEGGLNKSDISQILSYAEDDDSGLKNLGEPTNIDGFIHRLGKKVFPAEKGDIMTPYCDHLKELILDGADGGDRPLEGMRIVVDAGNGGGGFFAKRVLAPLGADISASQYLEPDGMFSNHAPNPEDKDAMNAISTRVISKGADFGIIFDTDVDRSAAVDGRGRKISGNWIVAMAAALISENHPGTTVVTDSITSKQLTAFLQNQLGLKHLRFKRGYKNVINKALELNAQGIDCQLAIETSGHAALKENYFLDDGAYLATKIVIKAALLKKEGKSLDSLLETLEAPADEKEIRIPITAENFGVLGDKILKDLEAYVKSKDELSLEEPNYEGVRINFPNGWCLLRKSLHDPILPMNMAADEKDGCTFIKNTMGEFLSSYEGLDLTAFNGRI
ncbi:MAG: phosphomannomutase/phosphoglucomutase [Clostridiales bacterium]|nr:phosphomannomutase/phosphoglucomutase [Clostridiales bacterium]